MPINASFISTLNAYLSEHIPHLAKTYKWKIDENELRKHLGISVMGTNYYSKNLDLKCQLAKLWLVDYERAAAVARYYVKVWGGIKANHDATIINYVKAVMAKKLLGVAGIASWSKILAAANPTSDAIFDARVSLSLNALQLISKHSNIALFPTLTSRNNIVRDVGLQIKEQGKKEKWRRISGKDTYRLYIELLEQATKGMCAPMILAQAEMTLFANAETLAQKAKAFLPEQA